MKYDHIVKKNGVYYSAGDDVPDETINTIKEETKIDTNTFSDEDIELETTPAKRGRPKKTDL